MLKAIAPYLGTLLIIGLLTWRIVRNSQGRRVRLSRLWIRPAILAVFLGLLFQHAPPLTALALGVYAAAAVAGFGFGYVLAGHQTLSVDQASGTIISKTSTVGTFLFLGLFAARFALRLVVGDPFAPHNAAILVYTDASLVFVAAMVAAQTLEVWRRAKPLLEMHRAAQKTPTLSGNQAE